MKRKLIIHLIALFGVLPIVSCSQEDPNISLKETSEESSETKTSVQTGNKQALLYAQLFSEQADDAGTPEELRGLREPREVDYVSYYIENQDTLLYAVNYRNDAGFIIISGDNSSFPIVAHSDEGNLNFSDIPQGSPLRMEVQKHAEKAKRNIHNPNRANTEYFQRWKDLGNGDYHYEITINNDAPLSDLRAYREYSTKKESIYPSTGKRLGKWGQVGAFNEFAPNKAKIGCPAIAIGMLLYDCLNRPTGKYELTIPTMPFIGSFADEKNEEGKEVSAVLKEIADSIPNYQWGKSKDAPSFALSYDVIAGLKKIGFKDAELVDYDFETLYRNLSFTDERGQKYNRGILLGGLPNGRGIGHVWFCDGYYEQSYKVTKKFLGITVSSWFEYDDRIYMNWGEAPKLANGWYSVNDDAEWTVKGGPSVNLKRNVQMIIGLHKYESR